MNFTTPIFTKVTISTYKRPLPVTNLFKSNKKCIKGESLTSLKKSTTATAPVFKKLTTIPILWTSAARNFTQVGMKRA
jgi:hypothetical protein